MKYVVVVEPTKTGFSGYLPDLDGCVATAPTKELLLEYLQEGAKLHIEGLTEQKVQVPKPLAEPLFIEIDD